MRQARESPAELQLDGAKEDQSSVPVSLKASNLRGSSVADGAGDAQRHAAALTVPDVDGLDTLGAALAYAAAGLSVGPIKRGSKRPGSVLGDNWPTKTSRDPEVIAAWFAGSDHGIFLHAGRSGAVIFDVDAPDKLPAILRDAIEATRPPFQATRDGATERGHYVFAAPPGRTFGNGTGDLGKGWGEVRGANGVVVVAPSVHAKADDGGLYAWASTGSVPTLPESIAAALPEAHEAVDAATDATVRDFLARDYSSATRPDLEDVALRSWTKNIEAGASRHESAVSAVIGVTKDAAAGLIDPRGIIDTLEGEFVAATTQPGRGEHQGHARSKAEARTEWRGIVAWAVAQAEAASFDPEAHQVRVAELFPPDVDADAEADFWQSSPVLTTIRDFAYARLASPWAVLGVVLARVACTIPPGVVLPPTIGSVASVNIFVALAGASGGGKGAASGAACDAVKIDGIDTETPGSGEGLPAAYVRPATRKERDAGHRSVVQYRTAVLFDLPEVDTLTALGSRQGSTLPGVMRSLWSGEKLGFAYRDPTKRLPVEAHTYRASLVLGVQPEQSGPLFDNAGGGTPQRFVWLPATDSRIGDIAPEEPEPITLDRQDWPRRLTLTIPDEVADVIRAAHVARMRGEGEALDGHTMLSRLKVAQLLTVLTGRRVMTFEDWQRAGVVMAVSEHTRSTARNVLSQQAEQQQQSRGRFDAIRSEAAAEVATDKATKRVVGVIRRHVAKAGPDGLSRSQARRKLPGRDREHFEAALDLAISAGDVEVIDTEHGQRLTDPRRQA